MLDLVYIGLVALPLTIAAVAMLLMAWRSVRGHTERKQQRVQRRAEDPGDIRAVARAVLEPPVKPSLVDLSSMVESLAHPPKPVTPDHRPIVRGAVGAETKRCPDCAEEVLAAARVCKHCRYRWDDPEWGSTALSA
jgi:hypothetical protein